jgi:hypothetical protein
VPPAYGIWRSSGPNEFEAKYEYFATAASPPPDFMKGAGWPPAGRGIFIEKITLAPDGESFVSTIRYEAVDVSGEAVAGGGTARGRGARIRF